MLIRSPVALQWAAGGSILWAAFIKASLTGSSGTPLPFRVRLMSRTISCRIFRLSARPALSPLSGASGVAETAEPAVEHVEALLSKSAGEQMKQSRNSYNLSEFVQKIFADLFVEKVSLYCRETAAGLQESLPGGLLLGPAAVWRRKRCSQEKGSGSVQPSI